MKKEKSTIQKMKHTIKNLKIDKNYILITIISLIIFSPFLTGEYFWGHDTYYHIPNVLALEKNFNIFNLFQLKIFPLIAEGYGYGTGIFYPPLSHTMAVLVLRVIGPSSSNVTNAMAITHFIALWLSGIFMYKLVKEISKEKSIAFIASAFYMTMPYHLIDIFVRDAFAESFVFPFLPMIFLGIHYLFQKQSKKFYLYFVIGYVCLINSHLVMAMYITFFVGLILLLNYKKTFQKEILKSFILATIIVILLSLPYLIPLLEHKILGDYAVFTPHYMASIDYVSRNRLRIDELFFNRPHSANEMIFYVNILVSLLFILFCYKHKEWQTKENSWLIKGILILSPIIIFMTTNLCPWEKFPYILLMLQFPWRLKTILCFTVSIGAAHAIKYWKDNIKSLIIILCLFSCFFYADKIITSVNFVKIDAYNINISQGGVAGREYYPINTINYNDYVTTRTKGIKVKGGNANIIIQKDETPDLEFKATNVSNTTLELPRIYYLGYEIIAKNDNETTKIPYYENEYGFIEINLDKDATIIMKYKGTILNRIGNFITIITTILFLFYLLKKKKVVT